MTNVYYTKKTIIKEKDNATKAHKSFLLDTTTLHHLKDPQASIKKVNVQLRKLPLKISRTLIISKFVIADLLVLCII